MSYKHLKERHYYEDLYDRSTVKSARQHIVDYEKFYSEFESKLPKDDKINRPGNALLLNVFYMQVVGNTLLRRYEERDDMIDEWIVKDEAKDAWVASARLVEEPCCKHCSKQGLRIVDKSLMHRGEHYEPETPEEVLFTLKCPNCEKKSAFWEDGSAWKIKATLCPKCETEMTHRSTNTKKAITLTNACPSCGHSYKDRLDLGSETQQPDQDYDQDRARYCLRDKEFREQLLNIRRDFEEMARLGKELKEEEDNKHINDAVAELKKPKIADLSTLLNLTLEKAGYIEFSLDKPEIGKDVVIGFNCLDNKSDRQDYDSSTALKKLIEVALKDTNWRLMTDGISYRLGYLSGRLRAYEREDDLIKLVKRTHS